MNIHKPLLVGRMLEIASGKSDLPPATVVKYRERWAAEGFELPELGGDYSSEIRRAAREPMQGVGDLIARGLRWFGLHSFEGCNCERRRQLLNRLFPFRKRILQSRSKFPNGARHMHTAE